jgi:hypothetical protein
MNRTFVNAELVVGCGGSRRYAKCPRVEISVETGERHLSLPNPFLNGALVAKGVMCEDAKSNESLLRPGRTARLRLEKDGRWTAADVLATALSKVRQGSKYRQLFEWEFIVVGQCGDALDLWPQLHPPPPPVRTPRPDVPGPTPGLEIEITDLLAMLDVSEELRRQVENDRIRTRITSEGGIKIV